MEQYIIETGVTGLVALARWLYSDWDGRGKRGGV